MSPKQILNAQLFEVNCHLLPFINWLEALYTDACDLLSLQAISEASLSLLKASEAESFSA